MTKAAFAVFEAERERHRIDCVRWSATLPWLEDLQDQLRREMGYEDYAIETPIVYNAALDEVGPETKPRFVLVADNPGKKEQLARNRRNLVGQSGKLAEGFFRRELDVDFRKEVVIINKTPLHTPKTAEIRKLLTLAGPADSTRRTALELLLRESQVEMARLAESLRRALGVPLWISGYGELGPRGLFHDWAVALGEAHAARGGGSASGIWVFRHFSMNQFAIEMKARRRPGQPLLGELERIGTENRIAKLGW